MCKEQIENNIYKGLRRIQNNNRTEQERNARMLTEFKSP